MLRGMSIRDYFPAISLEQAVDGVARDEIEYVFYGRMVNPEELKNADEVERQEQWEIRVEKVDGNASGGGLRVRKTNDNEYTFTSKTYTPGKFGKKEVELVSTVDQFEQFKMMAPRGMSKTRYIFVIPGTEGTWKGDEVKYGGSLFWEVDVFSKNDGSLESWVKIDLEVPSVSVQPPAFPIQLEETITNQYGKRTPEEEKFVSELYETKFTLTNQYLSA